LQVEKREKEVDVLVRHSPEVTVSNVDPKNSSTRCESSPSRWLVTTEEVAMKRQKLVLRRDGEGSSHPGDVRWEVELVVVRVRFQPLGNVGKDLKKGWKEGGKGQFQLRAER
jgi:hypothetical protein